MRWLEERTNKVARLVGESGVRPGDLAVMRPAGLGYVQHVELGIFENWLVKNLEITPTVSTALIRAQGHYKDQRNRSLNPLSWVEDLIFLPRNLLSALNPKIPKWVKDLVQIIYWLGVLAMGLYKLLQHIGEADL